MAIISSVITEKSQQADGRFYVTEVHTTDTGLKIPVVYLAEAADDHEARMLARVPELEAALLKEAEDAAQDALVESTDEKINAHLSKLTDQELKDTVGLTDAEVPVLREKLKK